MLTRGFIRGLAIAGEVFMTFFLLLFSLFSRTGIIGIIAMALIWLVFTIFMIPVMSGKAWDDIHSEDKKGN